MPESAACTSIDIHNMTQTKQERAYRHVDFFFLTVCHKLTAQTLGDWSKEEIKFRTNADALLYHCKLIAFGLNNSKTLLTDLEPGLMFLTRARSWAPHIAGSDVTEPGQ
jgi:hypothetical protein